jgi:EpsI family protein
MLVRLVVAIVIVGGAELALDASKLGPHETLPPLKKLTEFPGSFDSWASEDEPMDSELYANTGADDAFRRRYHDTSGHVVSFFMAQYSEFQTGLYHNPFNCYRTSGFTNLSSSKVSISSSKRPAVDVSVSIWEQKGEKCMVMYWYEVADQMAFERLDRLTLQKAFWGKGKLPPMYKTLMQMSIPAGSKPEDAQATMVYLAGKVRDFLAEASPPMEGH